MIWAQTAAVLGQGWYCLTTVGPGCKGTARNIREEGGTPHERPIRLKGVGLHGQSMNLLSASLLNAEADRSVAVASTLKVRPVFYWLTLAVGQRCPGAHSVNVRLKVTGGI